MNEILDFLMKQWQLSGLLVLVLGAYLIYEYMQGNNSDAITPEQAVVMLNHQHGVVIDVRTPEEFSHGHILNAVHFDSNEADLKLKRLQKYTQKPVILVCAHGRRSAQCLKRFKAQGFAQVYTLTGGLHAWQNAGLPLTHEG